MSCEFKRFAEKMVKTNKRIILCVLRLSDFLEAKLVGGWYNSCRKLSIHVWSLYYELPIWLNKVQMVSLNSIVEQTFFHLDTHNTFLLLMESILSFILMEISLVKTRKDLRQIFFVTLEKILFFFQSC